MSDLTCDPVVNIGHTFYTCPVGLSFTGQFAKESVKACPKNSIGCITVPLHIILTHGP